MENYTWMVGVTTVPSRRDDLLPKTLESLTAGGFSRIHLFVDSVMSCCSVEPYYRLPQMDPERVIHRTGKMGVTRNWILTLVELYLRNPHCHRYAVFQDDIQCYKNLKGYLDRCPSPVDGYWNLYTFPENENHLKANQLVKGWSESNQRGRSATGLVFPRHVLLKLLTDIHFWERYQDERRGATSIDGAIVTSMNRLGFKEYVHLPTLLKHLGVKSSIHPSHVYPEPTSWKGDDFDANTF